MCPESYASIAMPRRWWPPRSVCVVHNTSIDILSRRHDLQSAMIALLDHCTPVA